MSWLRDQRSFKSSNLRSSIHTWTKPRPCRRPQSDRRSHRRRCCRLTSSPWNGRIIRAIGPIRRCEVNTQRAARRYRRTCNLLTTLEGMSSTIRRARPSQCYHRTAIDDATINRRPTHRIGSGDSCRGPPRRRHPGLRPVPAPVDFFDRPGSDGHRLLVRVDRRDRCDRRGKTMTGVLVLFSGIAVIVWIIALLDWLARRKDRGSENHPAA